MQQNFQYQQIRELLRTLQSDKVSIAEEQLMGLSKSPEFLQILLSIMRNSQQIEWIKTLSASMLNRIFTDKSEDFSEVQLYEGIFNILMDSQIKTLDKRIFQKSIIKLLERSSKELQQKLARNIVSMLQNKNYFDPAYLLIACFAVADIPINFLCQIIQAVYETILTSLQVSLQNANLLNEMIKMWTVVINKLIQHEETELTLAFMINSKYLYDLIDLIYQFYAQEGFVVCLNSDLYELNMLKNQAAELHKKIIQYGQGNNLQEIVFNHLKKNIPKIIKTLQVLAIKDEFLNIQNSEDLATTFLGLTSIYFNREPEILTTDLIKIVNSIIFPLMKITEQERVSFEQSPQDFNSLSEDCCDSQTFGVLKTECAKLLQNIGSRYSEIQKYIVYRSVECLKVKLGFLANYSNPENYLVIEVQTAFLILSIFSYALEKYPQQIGELKIMLLDERMTSLQPLQISRIFGLLSYNYFQIFKDAQDGQKWIARALRQNVHPTTIYIAMDFICNIVEQFYNSFLVEALTEKIVDSKNAIIWQIISKLIQNHYEKIPYEGYRMLFMRLYQRIDKQMMELNQKVKNDTLNINNCLHIFITFLMEVEKQIKIQQNYQKSQQLLQLIWKITEFYQSACQIDLEDEIVKIATWIIKCSKMLDDRIYLISQNFMTEFKKNGSFQKVYLKYFNAIIIKCQFDKDINCLINVILTIKNALLKAIIEECQRHSKNKSRPIQSKKVFLGCCLILLQNVIAIHGKNLLMNNSKDFFIEVSSLCIRLLPNAEEPIQKGSASKIVMARALNLLVLCHLHLRTEVIYDYLKRVENEDLYHGYDAHVLLASLCKVVFIQTDITALANLISCIVTILIKAEEKDETILKKQNKKHLKQSIKKHLRAIADFNKFLKHLDTPFSQNKNSRDLLRQTLVLMRHNNAQIYNLIIMALPIKIREALKQIADIDHLFEKKRVIRKVKYNPNNLNNQKIETENITALKQMDEEGQSFDSDGEKKTGNNFKRLRVRVKVQQKMQKQKKGSAKHKPRKLKAEDFIQ